MLRILKSKLKNYFNKRKLLSYLLVFVVSLSLIITPPVVQSAKAWTWHIHHQGQALNTNHNFSEVNGGGPRLSTWSNDRGDKDQHFSFVWNDSKKAHMIVNLSTKSCLNVYRPAPGREVNTYQCNRGDNEQQFKVIRLRSIPGHPNSSDALLQVKNTNYCISNTDRKNYAKIIVNNCNSQDAKQVWRMDRLSTYIASDIVDKTPNTLPRTGGRDYVNIDGKQYFDMEVWIVARKRKQASALRILQSDTGHAFIGMVGRERYSGDWTAVKTYSFWPDTDLTINHKTDFGHLEDLINGKSISRRGQAVRKSRISNNRARWIMNGAYREAGCTAYRVGGYAKGCHCMDYSTRLWYYFTSKWEDFRMGLGNATPFYLTPDQLVNRLKYQTWLKNGNEFVDGGKRWQ